MKRVIFLLALVWLPLSAAAADRVALVIGNANYQTVAALDNPINDSRDVADALRGQDFDVVQADNLGRIEMREALRQFRTKADGAEVALVYYAGHGIEISGTNYLMPVDARLEDERDAGLEMVEMDLVLRQISGARTLKMVVLDACRNNPFIPRMRQKGGTRSARQGLADVRTAQSDTLIAYAAAAGEITPDGLAGTNSPFTSAFLKAMEGPPADVRRMLGRVRDTMRLSVPGAAPFVYSSLGGGEYILNPNSSGAAAAQPAPQPQARAAPSVSASEDGSISREFIRIDRDGTLEDWNEFIVKYEGQNTHPLYAFALEKRASLQGQGSVVQDARTAPVTSGEPTALAPQSEPVKPPEAPEPQISVKDAARQAQRALKERGCYTGRIDGDFGRGSKRGLTSFRIEAGLPERVEDLKSAAGLLAVAEQVAANPGVNCPVVVRKTQPKPRSNQTTTRRTTTTAAPAPQQKAEPSHKEPKGGNTTGAVVRQDATKFVPESIVDCMGQRKQYFDCD